MKWTLLMILGVFYFQLLRGQENRLEEILIESPALEKNLLGDPGSRYVSVYLPPSYFKDAQHRYPVVYFLHGNRVLSKERNILKISNAPIQNLLDSLIVGHKIEEMILVQPDARNFYGGCQYANSPVSVAGPSAIISPA